MADGFNPAQLLSIRPAGGFGVILADPPWQFENYSEKGEGKNPNQHYPCSSTDEIAAFPVEALAAADCALFMWAIFPMLPDALRVMERWGFTYKSAAPWAKQSPSGESWAFGPGYWFRGAAEILLFGTRGKPSRADSTEARSIRNLIIAPVREHSRKPDDVHRIAETWFPEARKVELFARQRRLGWAAWGNETGKFTEEAA